MLIKTLQLTSFRNYKKESFLFDPFINILIGDNAQGKTNVLEAIYLLSSGRSFKGSSEDMIYFDDEFSIIEGEAVSNAMPLHLKIVLSSQGKKAILNNKDIKRLSEYIGYLNVILFQPEDLLLIKGNPSKRRKLIDRELSKISPIYMYNITKYNKLLKERNVYLKTLKSKHKKADLYLEVLSEQMAELQVDLIQRRIAFVELLHSFSSTLYQYIANDELLMIGYETQYKKIDKDTILARYKDHYDRDIRYGKTQDGLQRDDLKITLNKKDATQFASQGQQRAIVLSIKMALLEIVKKQVGEYPILLLDDVLSELDDTRKTKLLNLIDGKVQTFVTTTSIEGLHHSLIEKAKKIEIVNGSIKEES